MARVSTKESTCQFAGCDGSATHELECLEPSGVLSRDVLVCDEHEDELLDSGVLVLAG
jgi:hypothetical protein